MSCRYDIDVIPECASTNAEVIMRAEAGRPSGTVVVAERQTAGRGRRGNVWWSAPGASLTFSTLWRFPAGTVPTGLSLVVGLVVATAIDTRRKQGARDKTPCRLKWPNDLLLDGRKLGGILIELLPNAPHVAVIGIGINLRLPDGMPDELRVRSAGLADGNGDDDAVSASPLLAEVLRGLTPALDRFAVEGFPVFRNAWMARHAWQDAAVRLEGDGVTCRNGICRGVAEDGALMFESEGALERVLSGEISLRLSA